MDDFQVKFNSCLCLYFRAAAKGASNWVLKTVEMYSLIAWLLEVQKPGVGRATLLPEAVREGSCLASSSLCWPQVFLGL